MDLSCQIFDLIQKLFLETVAHLMARLQQLRYTKSLSEDCEGGVRIEFWQQDCVLQL
jgi:hypothetical protein